MTSGEGSISEGPLHWRQVTGQGPADRDRPAGPVPVAAEIAVGLDGTKDR
jgi:hypothetical protein